MLLAFILMACITYAQSDKYVSAMQKNISMVDSVVGNNDKTVALANNFQRIAEAEKTQWLPYYYAAYLTAVQDTMTQDNSGKDAIADKAAGLLKSAEDLLGKENSEIYVIKSMIATAHMMVDPQARYMTYGAESAQALKKSIALDSTNPRPVLLHAEALFYTPPAFGGGKDVAKPLFDKAGILFASFKPETDLSPNWGEGVLDYFMKNYK